MDTKEPHLAELVNVTKLYEGPHGGTLALQQISFAADPGEMVLLLGPSGSGKTTFLTLLAGLQRPTSGEVFLFGKEVTGYTQRELQWMRAVRIGFIFQTFLLLDSLTVLQNVMIVSRFAGTGKKEAKEKAIDYLTRLGVERLSEAYPSRISQGEKQRVAVARALVNGAALIFADEPTGSLASKQGMEIVDFLKESVRNERRCIIMASHDERIIQQADSVLVLRDGALNHLPCK
ncbi:MAG: ABC transporter ATP-binding protein [Bacteroidota bacterium]|nr:ABC transporter ATP-binding protein [Bacteroidota bacterium]